MGAAAAVDGAVEASPAAAFSPVDDFQYAASSARASASGASWLCRRCSISCKASAAFLSTFMS